MQASLAAYVLTLKIPSRLSQIFYPGKLDYWWGTDITDPIKRLAHSGSKLFETLMVYLKELFEKG